MTGEPGQILDEPDGDTASGANAPLPLPIEAPLIRTVRALEALKAKADELLFVLEYMPNDQEAASRAIHELVRLTNSASAAQHSFSEIRSCRGQA